MLFPPCCDLLKTLTRKLVLFYQVYTKSVELKEMFTHTQKEKLHCGNKMSTRWTKTIFRNGSFFHQGTKAYNTYATNQSNPKLTQGTEAQDGSQG